MARVVPVITLFFLLFFISQAYGAEYYASTTSNKYHQASCKWAKKIKPARLIKFNTPEEAKNSGYIPCKYCKPPPPAKQKDESSQADKPADGKEFFNKGYLLSNSGNYSEAIKAFSKGIKINPGDAGAYYNRGLAYAKTGGHEKAIEDFNKAIELNPRYTMAYSNRGVVYLNMRLFDKANEDFNSAIGLDPSHYWAYYNKACMYSLKDEPDDACRWLARAIEAGYENWDHIRSDRDLNNIRETNCYKNLVYEK